MGGRVGLPAACLSGLSGILRVGTSGAAGPVGLSPTGYHRILAPPGSLKPLGIRWRGAQNEAS